MKYFFNKQITEITLPEQGYKVGNDIEEIDTFIPLNDKQLLDLEQHADWSAMEIWQGFKNPIVPIHEPTPIELFDYRKCESEMYALLSDLRQYELRDMHYTIVQLLIVKNFAKLKSTIGFLLQINRITQIEHASFVQVLFNNGINLNDY